MPALAQPLLLQTSLMQRFDVLTCFFRYHIRLRFGAARDAVARAAAELPSFQHQLLWTNVFSSQSFAVTHKR